MRNIILTIAGVLMFAANVGAEDQGVVDKIKGASVQGYHETKDASVKAYDKVKDAGSKGYHKAKKAIIGDGKSSEKKD